MAQGSGRRPKAIYRLSVVSCLLGGCYVVADEMLMGERHVSRWFNGR